MPSFSDFIITPLPPPQTLIIHAPVSWLSLIGINTDSFATCVTDRMCSIVRMVNCACLKFTLVLHVLIRNHGTKLPIRIFNVSRDSPARIPGHSLGVCNWTTRREPKCGENARTSYRGRSRLTRSILATRNEKPNLFCELCLRKVFVRSNLLAGELCD